jgi:hypothetical protein
LILNLDPQDEAMRIKCDSLRPSALDELSGRGRRCGEPPVRARHPGAKPLDLLIHGLLIRARPSRRPFTPGEIYTALSANIGITVAAS